MIGDDHTLQQAAAHLSQNDPRLAVVIAVSGLCTIRPHKNYYQALVREIIGQQLSTKAADAIEKRFLALYNSDTVPDPTTILTKSIDDLRGAGLSRAKAAYVRDLAQHVIDGTVQFDHLDGLPNEKIIKELTAVKGIGEWTAHMFMMFCMGRLDVLAHGDLGIKNGMQKLYGLKSQPDALAIQKIAKKYHWHPYESVACWYIWQSLDNQPIVS